MVASPKIGAILVLCLASLTNFLAVVGENSTAYIFPSVTMSEMCETVVPVDAPKYRTFAFSGISSFSNPFNRAAANFDLLGFHILYS